MAIVKEVDVKNSSALKLALLDRVPDGSGIGCFLCRKILEDLDMNGKLTNWPYDPSGIPEFSVTGKVEHLKVEGFFIFI